MTIFILLISFAAIDSNSQETMLVITHRDDFADDVYSFGILPMSLDSTSELPTIPGEFYVKMVIADYTYLKLRESMQLIIHRYADQNIEECEVGCMVFSFHYYGLPKVDKHLIEDRKDSIKFMKRVIKIGSGKWQLDFEDVFMYYLEVLSKSSFRNGN